MKFGPVPIAEAEGLILAHSGRTGGHNGGRRLKKGRVLTAEDVADLTAGGATEVIGARLEPGDVIEDEAANRVARASVGDNVSAQSAFTGRANLFSDGHGIAMVDRDRLDALNRVDEAVTIAAVPPYAAVSPRQMLATVKVIPFAVSGDVVERCAALAAEGGPLIRVAPYRAQAAGLIQTALPETKDSVLDKTAQIMAGRMRVLGGTIEAEARCAHDGAAIGRNIVRMAESGQDPILIVGASAIVDRKDAIPAGIEAAGGRVLHFGMPVDPGNLLLLGELADGRPVLGLPGCARSPKLNGVDWVLQRLAAGLPVGRDEIMAMGAGGLLIDTPARPLPRAEVTAQAAGGVAEGVPQAPKVFAVLLAAGQSRRMGSLNKLLQRIDGESMVARAADAILGAQVDGAVAVLGHEAEQVRAALAGRQVSFVDNPDFAGGLSTSLRRGLAVVPEDADAVLICLGDMPRVTSAQIDRLIAAFNPVDGRAICVPTHRGKRGNPVLWARRFVPEMLDVAGDVGARHLLGEHADIVCEVEMDEDAVLLDIDTPEALRDATA